MGDKKIPRWKAWGIIAGIVLPLMWVVSALTPKRAYRPDPSVDFAEIERAVDKLVREGAIKKIDLAVKEAYVTRGAWSLLNIDEKKAVARTLAYYCGYKEGSGNYWVDVKDFQSGKRLATWNNWGYSGAD